jgi:hypothetical protein
MKLAQAFAERHWLAAAVLTVGVGPLIGMLYLGRGQLGLIYGVLEVVAALTGFALGIAFNLIPPDLGADLGGSFYVALAPTRALAAVHATRIARAGRGAMSQSWFARRNALIGIAAALAMTAGLSAAVLRTFWLESFEMKSASMAPAVAAGDRLFVSKRAYDSVTPAVGDIVVVRDGDGIAYIRRIAALRDELYVTRTELPGDRPLSFPRAAIVGKVIAIYWTATARRWQWQPPS